MHSLLYTLIKIIPRLILIMDNFTSCEEYYESLKDFLSERNLTPKYFTYPVNNETFWANVNAVDYTKILAYVVIIVGGLIGNLNAIFTIGLIKSTRNAINFYIVNLAVADAAICIVCMAPHAISPYTKNNFLFGAFMCKFISFTQATCLISSVLTLSAISCDRFMAVFRPLQVRTTEKRTSIIIVVIWIISIAVSSPLLFAKKLIVIEWADYTETYCGERWPVSYYRNKKTNVCEIKQLIREIYHVILSIVLFLIPILIMFVTYTAILHKLWTSKIPGERSEANIQTQSRSKQKVLKMVIVVLIVFVLCWTPLQIILFIVAFGMDKGNTNTVPAWFIEFEWFSYYIAYANSFINPFIYGKYNKDFRNGFFMIFCCRQRKGRKQRENIFTKSNRSTTLSSQKSTTQTFISNKTPRNGERTENQE